MIFPFEEPEVDGPIGCAMVVDFGDGWRSVGTLTGVGPVKVDEYGLVSYEISFEPQRTFSATFSTPDPDGAVWSLLSGAEPSRVVNRVSPGLKKPPAEYIPGSFGEATSTIAKRLDRLIRQVAANTYIPPQYWVSPDVSRMDR
jgi:hypothetical protein